MTSEIEYTCNNCGHEGINTRAVPDVPELVTVRFERKVYQDTPDWFVVSIDDITHYLKKGNIIRELVTRDQAAAVIAAERSEKHRAQEAVLKLEKQNAQIKAQDPVAWLCEKLDEDDRFSKVVCNPLSVEKLVELGGVVTPLYAAPVPAPDLKAENERLRESLKKIHAILEADRTGMFEGLKNIINVSLGDAND